MIRLERGRVRVGIRRLALRMLAVLLQPTLILLVLLPLPLLRRHRQLLLNSTSSAPVPRCRRPLVLLLQGRRRDLVPAVACLVSTVTDLVAGLIVLGTATRRGSRVRSDEGVVGAGVEGEGRVGGGALPIIVLAESLNFSKTVKIRGGRMREEDERRLNATRQISTHRRRSFTTGPRA